MYIRKLKQSKFVRSVAVLATGTGIAQVISIIALPFITRLYHPSDFGIAALFLSITSVIGGAAALRYDQAIYLPKDVNVAGRLTMAAISIALVSSGLLLLFIITIKITGMQWAWIKQLGSWIYLLPLSVLFVAFDNIGLVLATRAKKFIKISHASVIQAAFLSGTRIIAGLLNKSVAGLIFSLMIGMFARLMRLWLPLKDSKIAHAKPANAGNFLKLLYEYRQFPFYAFPTDLLRSINHNLPVFALATLFNPAVVGLYAVGHRILFMPVQLFTEAVRRTYLQRSVELINDGAGIGIIFIKATGGLIISGLLIFMPVLMFGEQLFTIILGTKWSDAGRFAEILTPFLYFRFIQGPSGATFIVLSKQHILLKIHALGTLLITGCFVYSLLYALSAENTLRVYSVAASFLSIVIILTAFMLSSRTKKTGLA